MDALSDKAARANFAFWGFGRVFGAMTHLTCSLFGCVGIFLIIHLNHDDPGAFSQSLMFLLLISDFLQWALRQLITLDSYLSSAQRCFNIIDIPQ